MTLPVLGTLESLPALDHPDLLGPTVVAKALADWPDADRDRCGRDRPGARRHRRDEPRPTAAARLAAPTASWSRASATARSGSPPASSRADTRADVNNLVKRTLDVRKASFLAMDRAVEESAMEYGGITPVGLPAEWRLLVDARVVEIDVAVIGSGVRHSKLLLPGAAARRAPRRRGGRRPGRAARQLGTPLRGRVHPPATRKPVSRRTRESACWSTTTPPDDTARKGLTCRSRFATSPFLQRPCWPSRWR